MANPVKTKAILQIEESPRGMYQKMLVVYTPIQFSATRAFLRQHGANGLVLTYHGSGVTPKPARGRKKWEFDQGLVPYQLVKDTLPIQVDAEMHGSNLLIKNLPPEIYNDPIYTEVPAPAQIPKTGNPVRIMKPIAMKLSVFKYGSTSQSFCMAVYFYDDDLVQTLDRVTIKNYNGKDGFQLVQDPDGNKIVKNPQSASSSVRWGHGALPFTLDRVTVKQFAIKALYDEASQSIICEDALAQLRERVTEERAKIEVLPKARTNGHTNTYVPEEDRSPLDKAIAMIHDQTCRYTDTDISVRSGVPVALVSQMRAVDKPVDPNAQKITDIENQLKALQKALQTLRT